MPMKQDSVTMKGSSWKVWDDTTRLNADAKRVTDNLIQHINDSEIARFTNDIHQEFIFEKKTVVLDDSKKSEDDKTYTTEYKSHPLPEALFLNHPDELLRIVEALIKKNDYRLISSFKAALKYSGFNEELYTLTNKMKRQIQNELEDIHAHAKQLQNANNTRGDTLMNLHSDLLNIVDPASERKTPHTDLEKHSSSEIRSRDLEVKVEARSAFDAPDEQLVNLAFKLRIAARIHRDVDKLSTHRNNARWFFGNLGNILFGFCTAGIANAASRVFTGSWSIFHTTTTSIHQMKTIDKSMGFDADDVRFNKKPKLAK